MLPVKRREAQEIVEASGCHSDPGVMSWSLAGSQELVKTGASKKVLELMSKGGGMTNLEHNLDLTISLTVPSDSSDVPDWGSSNGVESIDNYVPYVDAGVDKPLVVQGVIAEQQTPGRVMDISDTGELSNEDGDADIREAFKAKPGDEEQEDGSVGGLQMHKLSPSPGGGTGNPGCPGIDLQGDIVHKRATVIWRPWQTWAPVPQKSAHISNWRTEDYETGGAGCAAS